LKIRIFKASGCAHVLKRREENQGRAHGACLKDEG